jgi:hypothetical protein
MARIKIENVLEHLDHDLSRALEDAVHATIPNAIFDRRTLYKSFVKAAYRKCSVWERVPDRYVEND